MTSTVLDVTVLLLCVSASVVALGGAGDVGGEAGVSGPTPDEVADRLSTETVTVRYRAPEAPDDARTVHATRTELIALLVANGKRSGSGPDAAEGRADANGSAFGPRARSAVVAGIDERTRIDATIATAGGRGRPTAFATADRRSAEYRSDRRAAGPIAVAGAANAPEPPRRSRRPGGGGSKGGDAGRSAAAEPEETVALGAEPPRSADVATAVVTQPVPGGPGEERLVQIVVRRW